MLENFSIKFFLFAFFIIAIFISPEKSLAIYDPAPVQNNRFGIHIIDENDMEDAAYLVNSSGGDWGYVKLVIQENDMNRNKWQNILDKARELHLIPIIRLATSIQKDSWEKPTLQQTEKWAEFLNSLNWVIKNRYIILFNEPNQAKEWGGRVNPKEYTDILLAFSKSFKGKSEDFFILNAGFDASAPNSPPSFMDEYQFLLEMAQYNPDIFNYLDGWASHSYPNPNFSASPNNRGKGSIRTFEWELKTLKALGLKKTLPVFITETGWVHTSTNEKIVSNFFKQSFKTVWNKNNVIAVTPFVLNYQDHPFDTFSWRKKGNELEFFEQYEAVQEILKAKGQPTQIHNLEIKQNLPNKLIQSSEHEFVLNVQNQGQSIWNSEEGFSIKVDSPGLKIETDIKKFFVQPYSSLSIPLKIKTPIENGDYKIGIELLQEGKSILPLLSKNITVISSLKLNLTTRLVLDKQPTGEGFLLNILDPDNKLEIISFNNIKIDKGVAVIPEVHNLIPNREYFFKLNKNYFLPKTLVQKLSEGQNTLAFGTLIPLDQDKSGNFNFKDFIEIVLHPIRSLSLFETTGD